MQGLGKYLNEKKDCSNATTIKDINSQYSYEDKIGGGLSDGDFISCGQDGSSSDYNELQRFYDEYILNEFKGLASNQQAIKALCECCKELPHESRTHDAFKKCVGEKLGIII